MFTLFTKSVARTALAAGTLGLAALVAAGTANAGSVDDQFLAALKNDGISYSNPQAVVANAKKTCAYLDQGKSPDAISQALQEAYPGLGEKGAKVFMVDSAKFYCPEHLA
jgi:hypothetical protein